MKKSLVILLFMVLAGSLILAGCSSPAPSSAPASSQAPAASKPPASSSAAAPAKVIEMKVDIVPVPNFWRTTVINNWADSVNKRSNGRLNLTVFPNNTLTPFPQKWDGCIKGVSDISEGSLGVLESRIQLQSILSLPLQAMPTAAMRSRAIWDLYQNVPEYSKGFSDAHVLFLHSSPPNGLITRKPITRVADMKGMKIWGEGAIQVAILEKGGMSPVELPIPDVYTSLQTGVIDGALGDPSLIISRNFGEVCKYYTYIDPTSCMPFFVIMNTNVWNNLPDDLKKVFNDLSGSYGVDLLAKGWDTANDEAVQTSKTKYNVKFGDLPADELAKWKDLENPVTSGYIGKLDSQGLAATKVYNQILKFVKEYKP
jgi:TRAP-type transport system periplasmic protein